MIIYNDNCNSYCHGEEGGGGLFWAAGTGKARGLMVPPSRSPKSRTPLLVS